MVYRTPLKASIAVLVSMVITGAGLGIMIWQAIDIFRPRVFNDGPAEESLIVLLLPLAPFLAGAWVCMLILYSALVARPASRWSGLYGLTEMLALFLVTVGTWVGAYIYFGGDSIHQVVRVDRRSGIYRSGARFRSDLGADVAREAADAETSNTTSDRHPGSVD